MTEILGYMQLGSDCCGYPFAELRDVTQLDQALKDAEFDWWMAPFVVFYRKDGVFMCDEISSGPDPANLAGAWGRHKDKIIARIKELQG